MGSKTIGNGRNLIRVEDLAALPSVRAVHEREGLSGKYRFYSTLQVVEALASEGWLPVLAKEQLVRNIQGQGFQKHLIRLRHQNQEGLSLNDILAEIVLTNAHNGLAAYNLYAAFVRLACWNGLIVSQAVFGAISFRHVGFELADVIRASKSVITGIPTITNRIREYRDTILTPQERYDFAATALAIRYNSAVQGQEEGKNLLTVGDRSFSISSLLASYRIEDNAPTLWNTFNIVQEKFTQGGDFERTSRITEGAFPGNTRTINRQKVAGIKAIDKDIQFNRALWDLLENTRQRKVLPL